ncbi:MAG: DUF2059 domain-containing protein, partial [Pseudorhodoplanes sp.]
FMTFSIASRILFAALLAVVCGLAAPASAQQQPSASAIALAKQIIVLKGSTTILEPLVAGVVEQTKNRYMQINFNLAKDLNEVSVELRKQLAPRRDALIEDVAKLYAQRFTEQEMKDTLAFYNTPLGKKLLTEDPIFVDQSLSYAQDWANKLSEEVIVLYRVEMKKRGHDL